MTSELFQKNEELLSLRRRLEENFVPSVPMHLEMLLPLLELDLEIRSASVNGVLPGDFLFQRAERTAEALTGRLHRLTEQINIRMTLLSAEIDRLLSEVSSFLSQEVFRNIAQTWFFVDEKRVCEDISEAALRLSEQTEGFCRCIGTSALPERELAEESVCPAQILRLASALYPVSESDRFEALLRAISLRQAEAEALQKQLQSRISLEFDLLFLAEQFQSELLTHLSAADGSYSVRIPNVNHLRALHKSVLAFRIKITHRIESDPCIQGGKL